MAEEFGDFGTPPTPGGPPSGSPLPSDTEAAKKAAESMKDLTEKVKDLKSKTELAVERIMDLSKEGFRLNESLRKNYEDMKKLEEKRKLGLKLTDDEIKQEKQLAALQNKNKEELKKVGKALVKLRDSLESSEEVQEHANKSLNSLADALDDYADGIPRQLTELEKELKPINEALKGQKESLQQFGDSVRGMAKALPSFKDSLKAGFALGVGKLVPLIADSFGKGTKASSLNLSALFDKKKTKKSQVDLLEELIKETQNVAKEVWFVGDLLVENVRPLESGMNKLGDSVSKGITLLIDTISSTQKDIKAVLVSTRSSGGMTAVVGGGDDLVAEFLNMLVDEVKELQKIATVVVTNTSEMSKALGEMKDSLIRAVVAQQESALEISDKERASPAGTPAPAGEPAKPGEKAEAAPPKPGKFSNFMSAAKQGAQAMLMIAGSLVVLALGLKMMKDIDLTTMTKAAVAMTALGTGLFFMSRIPSVRLKRTAEAMIVVAASLAVLAIGLKLMQSVGYETMLKTGLALGGLVGVLFLLNKLDTTKLLKASMSLFVLGMSLLPLAISLRLMAGVNWKTLLVAGVALGGMVLAIMILSNLGPKALLAALAIAAVAASMALFVGSVLLLALGLKVMQGVGWETIGKLAVSLFSLGLVGAVSGPLLAIGAVGIGAMGLALIALGAGLAIMSILNWDAIMAGMWSLVKVAFVAQLLAVAAPLLLVGSAALGALGLALVPLMASLAALTAIGSDNIMEIGMSIVAFGLGVGILGLLSPLIVLASVALGVLAVGLGVLAVGLALVIPPMVIFTGALALMQAVGLSVLHELASIGMNGIAIGAGLVATAVGIGAVGAALMAFGAMGAVGQVTGAIGDAVSGVLGFFTGKKAPTPIEMLGMFVGFAEMAPKINEGAMAINALADALQRFSNTKFGEMVGLDKIGSLVDKIQGTDPGVFGKLKSMGESLMAFAVSQPPPKEPAVVRAVSTSVAGVEGVVDTTTPTGGLVIENNRLVSGNKADLEIARDRIQSDIKSGKLSELRTDYAEERLKNIERLLALMEEKQAAAPVTNVINNTNAPQMIAPPSGGGGGATMIPLYSGSHTDATKVAYQVSYRPAG